jgi:flagellar basal-body rod protein FlgG
MSVQSLYTAATGMDAMQTKLDVIANNLANINTTAFKRDRANFEDLMYRNHIIPGMQDAAGNPTPTGLEVGLGARVQSTQSDFRQGTIQDTGRDLDIAIEGRGFLQVTDPSSQQVFYTRAGNLNINANNALVIGSAQTGRLLEPPIQIPEGIEELAISPNGVVSVRLPGEVAFSEQGSIQLATFINPDGLLKEGENMFSATDASGPATPGGPGQQNFGVIRQSALEASNVEPVKELIDLITTQRGFELNSQAIQAGDQVLQQITNLRRG